MCGHVWDCPACASRIRAERGATIAAAVQELGGHWAMLTLTVRHHNAMPLRESMRVLLTAWRQLRKQGSVARPWHAHVRATVRATELTYGGNGWHPHLHVFARLSGTEVPDKLEIAQLWRAMVEKVGGAAFVPELEVGAHWSAARKADGDLAASYASKLCWEATGAGKPAARSVWALLERAALGDEPARALWEEYVWATKGRRAIELDDRCVAAALARKQRECSGGEQQECFQSSAELVLVEREEIALLRMYESVEPGVFDRVLGDAETDGAKAALSKWLGRAEQWDRERRVARAGPAPPVELWPRYRNSS